MKSTIQNFISFVVAIFIAFIPTSCGRRTDSVANHTLVSYEFGDSKGQKQTFGIWSYTALTIDNKPVFARKEVKADEKTEYADGTVLVFERDTLYLNGHKEKLQPGNYVLNKGVLEEGFIRTFD